jgi:hypothetical protein
MQQLFELANQTVSQGSFRLSERVFNFSLQRFIVFNHELNILWKRFPPICLISSLIDQDGLCEPEATLGPGSSGSSPLSQPTSNQAPKMHTFEGTRQAKI